MRIHHAHIVVLVVVPVGLAVPVGMGQASLHSHQGEGCGEHLEPHLHVPGLGVEPNQSMSLVQQSAVLRVPKARLDALGRQDALCGGPVDVVGDGLVGFGLDGDPDSRYLVQSLGHGTLEAIPHGHEGRAVEVAVAIHPGPGDGHLRR